MLLRFAGRVLYFAFGRHRTGDVEDDHDLYCGLRGRRVAFDFDEGGVFDALDDIIRIIRASSGKADAAKKILKKYKQLDEEQTDAILELKLYRLAKLEINLVLDELEAKRTRAGEIRDLLGDDDSDPSASGRWGIVRDELKDVLKELGKSKEAKRRTVVEAPAEEVEYSEEDFIVAEDTHLLVTRDGWVKRQKEIKEPSKSRIRDGDSVLACVAGSTRATVGFFSSAGTCYTARFADLPSSTGFGEPIQKLFKLKDGERIVAVISFAVVVSFVFCSSDRNCPFRAGIRRGRQPPLPRHIAVAALQRRRCHSPYARRCV